MRNTSKNKEIARIDTEIRTMSNYINWLVSQGASRPCIIKAEDYIVYLKEQKQVVYLENISPHRQRNLEIKNGRRVR